MLSNASFLPNGFQAIGTYSPLTEPNKVYHLLDDPTNALLSEAGEPPALPGSKTAGFLVCCPVRERELHKKRIRSLAWTRTQVKDPLLKEDLKPFENPLQEQN